MSDILIAKNGTIVAPKKPISQINSIPILNKYRLWTIGRSEPEDGSREDVERRLNRGIPLGWGTS
jgi:hypothetical protein